MCLTWQRCVWAAAAAIHSDMCLPALLAVSSDIRCQSISTRVPWPDLCIWAAAAVAASAVVTVAGAATPSDLCMPALSTCLRSPRHKCAVYVDYCTQGPLCWTDRAEVRKAKVT